VVRRKEIHGGRDLPLVVHAQYRPGLTPHPTEYRQHNSHDYGDDGNNHKQFDQRKAPLPYIAYLHMSVLGADFSIPPTVLRPFYLR
jgi:hypothetical protein